MHVAITSDPKLPVPPRLYGGIERIVGLLANGLLERGHRVTLFAHPDSEVHCQLVPYGGTSQHPLGIVRNAASVSRLVFCRPDIIHSFGRLAYLTALLPTAIPKIMSYQRTPTLGRVKMAARLAQKDSLVFTGCSDHITKQISRHATACTVYNGVALETYQFRPLVDRNAPLVFLGRIERIKGTHTAIEVARRSGRRLIIAGNIPNRKGARSYFRECVEPFLDGDRIRFVGPVDDGQKNNLLGRAAALLMPIEWEEPFGIVMAEAMACGTPVIGMRRGAVPEVIEHGVTGFVGTETKDLVEAVEKIGELDRTATRRRCERLFSDVAVVGEYESLYRNFISHPNFLTVRQTQ